MPVEFFLEQDIREFFADMYQRVPARLQVQLEENVFSEVEEWRPYMEEPIEKPTDDGQDLFNDF